ncbi:MAG: hypothetical protein LBG11_09610, partial [Bifidobacteriaceae bacterium]|nr:hypothetical protein [Bifidobacteriaceae bacterium]
MDSGADRETLFESLLATLVGVLKTNPAKEIAREAAKRFDKNYDTYQQTKRFFRRRPGPCERKSASDRAVKLYLMLSL